MICSQTYECESATQGAYCILARYVSRCLWRSMCASGCPTVTDIDINLVSRARSVKCRHHGFEPSSGSAATATAAHRVPEDRPILCNSELNKCGSEMQMLAILHADSASKRLRDRPSAPRRYEQCPSHLSYLNGQMANQSHQSLLILPQPSLLPAPRLVPLL